jgi:hypothetical protein
MKTTAAELVSNKGSTISIDNIPKTVEDIHTEVVKNKKISAMSITTIVKKKGFCSRTRYLLSDSSHIRIWARTEIAGITGRVQAISLRPEVV